MRFLLDMPLPHALVRWLNKRGNDAVHVLTLGMDRATDTEILAYAKHDRRTVLTTDLDYPRLLALAGALEPSLILFRGGDWNETSLAERLEALFSTLDEAEIAASVIVIDHDRVRRRRLPLG